MKCIDHTFRTALPVQPRDSGSLSATSRILLLGSCFTDNIGGKLLESGVPATVNPAGALYNPGSIAAVLRAAMRGDIEENTIFEYESRFRTWLLPTRFSSPEKERAREIFTDTLTEIRTALKEADTLVFTFGTAWVYEHTPTPLSSFSGIVSNCHKVPSAEFIRRRLSIDEIVADWLSVLAELRTFRGENRQVNVIFTVSPIRHFKDGAHENTLSKATLHLAIAELLESSQHTRYFPAWELVMDDLRDYRFYAEDMLHPSPTAVEYIWQHFQETYFIPADRERLAASARQFRRTLHRQLL
ncbi:MAG: GSCFA domain-containing protein [Prevotella sp.]|nr:GSCFA domain-containing protein [Prevotella sp.]MCM1074254.1 GSCFA domain-containing protein [Ruminococcus sp.]